MCSLIKDRVCEDVLFLIQDFLSAPHPCVGAWDLLMAELLYKKRVINDNPFFDIENYFFPLSRNGVNFLFNLNNVGDDTDSLDDDEDDDDEDDDEDSILESLVDDAVNRWIQDSRPVGDYSSLWTPDTSWIQDLRFSTSTCHEF